MRPLAALQLMQPSLFALDSHTKLLELACIQDISLGTLNKGSGFTETETEYLFSKRLIHIHTWGELR